MTEGSSSTPCSSAAGGHHEQQALKPFKHAAVAQLCYFVLGTGLLTGWNAFLTASDYFNAVLPGRNIDRVFTVTYLPITLCLIAVVSLWPRLVWSGPGRIAAGYCLFTLCCAAVPVIDVFLVQQGSMDAAYGLVLLCVVLTAVGDGITQPTVYADAAVLPDKYTQSVVMGAAASGVTMGVLRCITKGATPQTLEGVRVSAQAYFAASAAITAAALLLYLLVLPRLDVVQYCRGKLQEDHCLVAEESAAAGAAATAAASRQDVAPAQHRQDDDVETAPYAVPQPDVDNHHHQQQQQQQQQQCDADCQPEQQLRERSEHTVLKLSVLKQQPSPQQQRQKQHLQPAKAADLCQAAAAAEPAAGRVQARGDSVTWLHILGLNWRLCVAVFMTYCVTLSIFPGFLAENVHSAALGGWYPVLLIFIFNIFDFLGRCIPEGTWHPKQLTLLALALCRLALTPLYAGLAVYGASEAAFFILTAVLGGSNGWLTSLIFCAAPRGLSPSAAETAGMMNVLAELAGLNAGAYLGWLWTIGKV